MKITICDVCSAEGKIVRSKYRVGFVGGVKADVCKKHKGHFNSMGKNESIEEMMRLEEERIKVGI